MSKIVYFDMDNILVDFLGVYADNGLLQKYNKMVFSHERLTIESITTWDLSKCAKYPLLMDTLWRQPGFLRDLAPMPGAADALRRCQAAGLTVRILTSPGTWDAFGEKAYWVKRHLPMVAVKDLIIDGHKGDIYGDVLVDDGPHNAEVFRARNPKALILTLDYAFAQSQAYDGRFDSLDDVASAVIRFAGPRKGGFTPPTKPAEPSVAAFGTRPENLPPQEVVYKVLKERSRQIKSGEYKS